MSPVTLHTQSGTFNPLIVQYDNFNDPRVGVNADTQSLYRGPKHQDILLTV